nr:uncharacterized protein LOC112785395 [Arachis hypogaea]
MPGIDLELMSHKLSVYSGSQPVQQRRRKLGLERAQVVEEQIRALLEADFIREVKYLAWLANVVLVKKQNGKWRMCVDYTDLNKACPKDLYPLPNIDTLAEYEALIAGLKLAEEVGATKVVVLSDSQVVTSQINGEYQAKDPNMKRNLDKTLEYLRRFSETEVRHITQDLNSRVDALSKLASTKPGGNNRRLIQETLQEPSVTKTEAKQDVLEVSSLDLGWMTPLIEYIKFNILPKEEKEAKKIQRKA